MLEGGGVDLAAGVLLLTACAPEVNLANLAQVRQANMFTVHTLALCPSTDSMFDQLAGPWGESWVLPPGPVPPPAEEGGEHRAAWVLTAATRAALAMPKDPMLVKVSAYSPKTSL